MSIDISSLGVAGLASALGQHTLTCVAATQYYLDRIEQTNPAFNAFLTVFAETAISAARAADKRRHQGQALSALDGVPIALKDNIAVAGSVTTNGVGALRDNQSTSNAFVVQQLLEAGCVILGKLNMDEAALGATTNNPHFGRTENPSFAGDTPGGSSGGSVAAVAAGLCAAALGTDTLGSVRIPAAYCGTAGLIGTRGMVSRRGVFALSTTLDQVGVLARGVDDAAAIYKLLCGYDAMDDQSLHAANSFVQGAENVQSQGDANALSIGVVETKGFTDTASAADIAGCMQRGGQWLVGKGHTLQKVQSPSGFTSLRRTALLVIEAEGYVACSEWLQNDGVSPSLQKMLNYGAGLKGSELEFARAELRQVRRQWHHLFEQHDFLLLPTAPQTSFPAGDAVPVSQADFTTPASVAGLPAISIPAATNSDGRNLALQLVGPPHSDWRLCRLAAEMAAGL